MSRFRRILGLTSVAAVMLSLSLATPAFSQFESESFGSIPLEVSSNAMQKIAPSEGSTAIECTTVRDGVGALSGTTSETLSVYPEFSNCETFLGATTTVNTNACSFKMSASKGSTTGTFTIPCASPIVVTVGSICRYSIYAILSLNSVSFKNTGSGTTRGIVVEPNVKGLEVERTTNDFFCPAGGKTGTYTGNFTLTGTAGGHIGIFVD
jgi:hypothetical protein